MIEQIGYEYVVGAALRTYPESIRQITKTSSKPQDFRHLLG